MSFWRRLRVEVAVDLWMSEVCVQSETRGSERKAWQACVNVF